MKTLVIGGCGFIGSHVVDALLASGASVRVFDRQHERFRPPLRGVEYCIGDFAEKMAVAEALTGMDTVVHLVSSTFPGTANLAPAIDVRDNLINTLGLLDLMVEMRIPRLVFLSSGGTVYGALDRVPVPEDHPLRPINSYGIVKVAIEHYLEMYRHLHGIQSLVARASNPYGPRQGHSGVQGVISTFLRRVHEGEPIEIWGDGSVVRDYLYVSDLAEFCVLAARGNEVGAFNVGSGEGRSINEIIEIIRAATGVEIKPHFKPGRAVDVPRSVLDISRAEKYFGWRPKTSISDGIAQAWDWARAPRPDRGS
jgi:UDP-glucose 4-epimerase